MQTGTQLGHYTVLAPLGKGGMGEVWKARDTTLGREVAIKTLPESFATDADRLARFEREARLLASLNHPNIAVIYGFEEDRDTPFLVLELVEGDTLADRLARGALPIEASLKVALQIAEALEAAHEKDVIHRDLKPANVKITPDGKVKVLDFGLAKVLANDAQADPSSSPTLSVHATRQGVVLGTTAYMSPEQARGDAVDRRADIWAFGCVLFEMLTGQRTWTGRTVTDILGGIVAREPNWNLLPPDLHPRIRYFLERCLEKEAKDRCPAISEARTEIQKTLADPGGAQVAAPATVVHASSKRPWIGATAAAALLAGAAAWVLKPEPAPVARRVTRFDYQLPENVALRNPVMPVIDMAADGSKFVVNGTDGLYVRSMNESEARLIPGTDGPVASPVLAPDGEHVAYFQRNPTRLMKIAINGGTPIVVAGPLSVPLGMSWETDGTILYGQPDGIWRVSENGGTPAHILTTDAGEQAYGPQLLPGGEWILFTLARLSVPRRWDEAKIAIASLSSGERRVLRTGGADARYVSSGHVVYASGNVLFGSTFEVDTLELGEERVSLVQDVARAGLDTLGNAAFYGISDEGTLAYVPGTAANGGGATSRGLAWVDRSGNELPIRIRSDNYTMARISPDGSKVALVVGSALPASDPLPDIWIFDLATQNLRQLTFDPASDDGPVWTSDSDRIYFRSYRGDVGAVYAIPAEGGDAELIARDNDSPNPYPWSLTPDNRTLVLTNAPTLQDVNISVIQLNGDRRIMSLLDERDPVSGPVISPNGAWMAYQQRGTINVRPFPGVTQQRFPVGAGRNPVFSRNGSKLFYFDGQGLVESTVALDPFRVGEARSLFHKQYWYGVGGPEGDLGRAWDVDPDGERFLMITLPGFDATQDEAARRRQVKVVLNWSEELKERVPTR